MISNDCIPRLVIVLIVAIAGVGSTRGARRVRWGVAGNIVWAWILTIPCSALIAGAAWWLGTKVL